jgi:hypothetical protein
MFLARLVLRNAHQLTFLSSYEAILLAPGENKIDVDVDTRKFSQAHDSSQKASFRNQKKTDHDYQVSPPLLSSLSTRRTTPSPTCSALVC